jgi:hypothetical protein
MKKLLSFDLSPLRKYLSEKNALTVMTSLFCFVMIIVAVIKQDVWLAVGFALAFSFSVEVICHRTRNRS